jgi:predicted nucleic-acid-binding protein
MSIALDTNVLDRFLKQDAMEQFEIARDVFNSGSYKWTGFICLEVLMKLVYNSRTISGHLPDERKSP